MNIFIADEQPLLRQALDVLICRISPVAATTHFECVSAMVKAIAAQGPPELICMDLQLLDATGVSAIATLRQLCKGTLIAVFTALPADGCKQEALQAGANVFIEKLSSTDDISRALGSLLGEPNDPEPVARAKKLTKRQTQLLLLIDKGMGNRDIADNLQISEHTVKVHLWRLFRQLNVSSRSQASHLARANGLLQRRMSKGWRKGCPQTHDSNAINLVLFIVVSHCFYSFKFFHRTNPFNSIHL